MFRKVPVLLALLSFGLTACMCSNGISVPGVSTMLGNPRTGEDLFTAMVLDPIPESVTVLHSQDQRLVGKQTIWLHFTIDPGDYDVLFEHFIWEEHVDRFLPEPTGDVVNWWAPDTLPNVAHYQVFDASTCRCWKQMYVNAARTEVYFYVAISADKPLQP